MMLLDRDCALGLFQIDKADDFDALLAKVPDVLPIPGDELPENYRR